jgi:hypothetical protein
MISTRYWHIALLCALLFHLALGASAQQELLAGRWFGQLPGAGALELHLEQRHQVLTGRGRLDLDSGQGFEFQSDDGSVNKGNGIMIAVSEEPEFKQVVVELELRDDGLFVEMVDLSNGETYVAVLVRLDDTDTVLGQIQSSQIRLWADIFSPLRSMGSAEEYRAEVILEEDFRLFETASSPRPSYRMALNFDFRDTTLTEYIGSWRLDQASSETVLALGPKRQFLNGRVAAYNWIGDDARCTVIFKTPDTLTALGGLRFNRFSNGVPGRPRSGENAGAVVGNSPATWRFLNREGRGQTGSARPRDRLLRVNSLVELIKP